MKNIILQVSLSFLCLSIFSALPSMASGNDPYQSIEMIKLDNGLQVVLAPSAEATTLSLRVEVGTGVSAEDKTNWGISHLLEHVLFRDKGLKDEMSYLQLIREEGGSANGGTQDLSTFYIGTVSSAKGAWLLSVFGKMLLKPEFNDEYVEKEKGTVEIERGRPGPITEVLGFNPSDYLFPSYFGRSEFWYTDFGVSYKKNYTLSEEQLSNRRLTTEQVKEYYKEYYYAGNMRLIVAGKFNRQEIMSEIEKSWAVLPVLTGKTTWKRPGFVFKRAPYVGKTLSTDNSYVYLGTKLESLSSTELQVVDSYLEFVAHRLMKEIRNKKGQTYSAWGTTATSYGYGTGTVGFNTQNEFFKENLKMARELMEKEARSGEISDELISEAKSLYLKQYEIHGKESADMMNLAQTMIRHLAELGEQRSPYMLLQSTTPAAYREILQKHFSAETKYEYTYEPPLFFRHDVYFFYLAVLAFCLFGIRRWVKRPFSHSQIRWVRKVTVPPLFSMEIFGVIAAWYLFTLLYTFLDRNIIDTSLMQSNLFTAYYLGQVFYVVAGIASAVGLFCLIPRKLMVVGDRLVVKSKTYFSFSIPLSEINSVELAKHVPFKNLMQIGLRYFYYDMCFWRPGLLLKCKNGKAYFFSVSEPIKAKAELEQFLSPHIVSEIRDIRKTG